MSLENKVLDIVSKCASIDVEKIDQTKSLREIGLDSLDLMDMNSQIEEEIGIAIPDEEWEKFDSIKNLVEFVKQKA